MLLKNHQVHCTMFGFGKKKNEEANALPSGNEDAPEKEGGLFSRLKRGLAKTGGAITEGMENLVMGKKKIDDE